MVTGAKFNEGTKIYRAYQVLSDKKWHCGKHELPGTQSAGLVRELINRGAKIEKASKYCPVCNEETTHRKMI
jgi:hypothetical protein